MGPTNNERVASTSRFSVSSAGALVRLSSGNKSAGSANAEEETKDIIEALSSPKYLVLKPNSLQLLFSNFMIAREAVRKVSWVARPETQVGVEVKIMIEHANAPPATNTSRNNPRTTSKSFKRLVGRSNGSLSYLIIF